MFSYQVTRSLAHGQHLPGAEAPIQKFIWGYLVKWTPGQKFYPCPQWILWFPPKCRSPPSWKTQSPLTEYFSPPSFSWRQTNRALKRHLTHFQCGKLLRCLVDITCSRDFPPRSLPSTSNAARDRGKVWKESICCLIRTYSWYSTKSFTQGKGWWPVHEYQYLRYWRGVIRISYIKLLLDVLLIIWPKASQRVTREEAHFSGIFWH